MVKDLSSRFLKSDAGDSSEKMSCISEGTIIKGDIISEDSVRLDGKMEGQIDSKSRVVVGERAVMRGNINSGSVDFYGKIEGDLTVKDVLSLKNTACVTGNIHTRKIQVDLGAQINGSCHMLQPETSAPVSSED